MTAKILVVLTLAAAYTSHSSPMLVYVYHVGVPLLLKRLLIWAPGLLFISVAIGTLIGVLFIGDSIAAPAATGMGVLLACAGFVPLQELLVAQANGANAHRPSHAGQPRGAAQERAWIHARDRKYPSHHGRARGSAWHRGRRSRSC